MLMNLQADRSDDLVEGVLNTLVCVTILSVFADLHSTVAAYMVMPQLYSIFGWAVFVGAPLMASWRAYKGYRVLFGTTLGLGVTLLSVVGLTTFLAERGFSMPGDSHFIAMQASVNASIGHLVMLTGA